ncbi:flavodoxin [Limosilactobacillus fastidiosus]|uniref:Flavodoxin n=1 Tax=Limosilactobacillus fastidiosus TaxID=2759855 RepID=A0A7W3U037_9LACO|nr:flavodoxin [Limosilactobacillus fastidiosus]MBB1062874.1 flavodoxin [Limosilactobacillus fastidiosus]MBB1086457.1 flavodoxin [Limosilactobacillus fastidiosus]MCD7084092.1 flavodoxin [Limosilactobacillus fastidiosus]MCD7086337.1 flavodoxin [Limosilactobacillus fastidiosus]MCD7114882.1 flavodoxin [Limosilactobacillus fastidiosus]
MANTLVLYYSATGTTKKVAEKISQILNADIAEIHPVTPYSNDDLNWHNKSTRATVEQKQEHDGRVPIKDDLPSLDNYDNVIIGHPIWWGIPPRLIATAIDNLALNGKRLATFGTSSSTGYDRAQSNVERTVRENNYDVKVAHGDILNSRSAIKNWLNSLNF